MTDLSISVVWLTPSVPDAIRDKCDSAAVVQGDSLAYIVQTIPLHLGQGYSVPFQEGLVSFLLRRLSFGH